MPFPALLEGDVIYPVDGADRETVLRHVLAYYRIHLYELPNIRPPVTAFEQCVAFAYLKGRRRIVATLADLRVDARLSAIIPLVQAIRRYEPNEFDLASIRRGAAFVIASSHRQESGFALRIHRKILAALE